MTYGTGLLAATTVALALTATAANAASNRVWVSGHGTDTAGCGAPTAPCRSLQYALDHAVNAGGEIDILDPAGYGAITITKDISIVNDGVGTAGVQAVAGSDAITINAGPEDTIFLKGLNVDGVRYTGFDGIDFTSGKSLTVADCVFRHFHFMGIYLDPQVGLPKIIVTNTTTSDNLGNGIYYDGTTGSAATQLVIDHLLANNNANGVFVNVMPAGAFVEVSVNSSVMTNNSSTGIEVTGNAVVGVDSSVMEANTFDGASASFGAILHLSRSVLIQNGQYGVSNAGDLPDAVFSTGDNRVFGNNQGATFGTITSESPH